MVKHFHKSQIYTPCGPPTCVTYIPCVGPLPVRVRLCLGSWFRMVKNFPQISHIYHARPLPVCHINPPCGPPTCVCLSVFGQLVLGGETFPTNLTFIARVGPLPVSHLYPVRGPYLCVRLCLGSWFCVVKHFPQISHL